MRRDDAPPPTTRELVLKRRKVFAVALDEIDRLELRLADATAAMHYVLARVGAESFAARRCQAWLDGLAWHRHRAVVAAPGEDEAQEEDQEEAAA